MRFEYIILQIATIVNPHFLQFVSLLFGNNPFGGFLLYQIAIAVACGKKDRVGSTSNKEGRHGLWRPVMFIQIISWVRWGRSYRPCGDRLHRYLPMPRRWIRSPGVSEPLSKLLTSSCLIFLFCKLDLPFTVVVRTELIYEKHLKK